MITSPLFHRPARVFQKAAPRGNFSGAADSPKQTKLAHNVHKGIDGAICYSVPQFSPDACPDSVSMVNNIQAGISNQDGHRENNRHTKLASSILMPCVATTLRARAARMSSIAYAIPTVLVADESIRRRLAMLPSPVTEMLAISLPMAERSHIHDPGFGELVR
jgi:hypothetical protein